MDAIYAAHAAVLKDIEGTFRSQVNYSAGTMVGDAPCCNASNAACRCEAQ